MTTYHLEIRGVDEWAGKGVSSHQWQPAIAGTLNQTGESDTVASTFATLADAEAAREFVRQEMGADIVELRITTR